MKRRILAMIFAVLIISGGMPICINAENDGIELKGYSVGLSDCICLRYYFSMSEETHDGDGYVRFVMQSTGKEKKISFSEGKKNEESGYYVYSFEVAPAEMSEKISCSVCTVNGTSISAFEDYSVKEYAEDILAKGESEYSKETLELVRAMLNYGAYSQKYFHVNEHLLANAGIEDNVYSKFNELEDKDIKGTFISSGDFSGWEYVATTLALRSNIVMYHYFRIDEGVDLSNFTFWFGDNANTFAPVLAEIKGEELYCFKSLGIPPTGIRSGLGLQIINTTETNKYGSLTVSPSAYLYYVTQSVHDNADLVSLAKATYLYAIAAEKYAETVNT